MLVDLRARDFRRFGDFEWHPAPGVNFLIGPNAVGKTSVLEAACLLLRLQSPQTSTLGECTRLGQDGFAIGGHWDQRHLRVKYAGRLKQCSLDAKTQSSSADYLAVARVAWISNGDLDLVRGGGSARRRFLDFLGAQAWPGYLRQLRIYERALRSRNALLRERRPRGEVAAFDAPLCAAGDFLLEARAQMTSTLKPRAAAACRDISGADDALDIAYRPGADSPLEVALEASRSHEERLGMTVAGPHRDDLALRLNGLEACAYASEGQQRSIALALKMAQSQELAHGTGQQPLYLIDDIFGELDTERRNHFLRTLPPDAQKIITTTTLDWLADSEITGTAFGLRRTESGFFPFPLPASRRPL